MELLTITNLNSYIKGLERKTAWDLKQQTGDYTAKGLSLDEWLSNSQTQSTSEETAGSHSDEKLRAIHTKLDAGGKLTPKEREYLKNHDPQSYQDLIDQERAQRAYEQALRRCKTQEEVKRLQTNRINKSMMVVRSIEHNPHITQQKKLEIAMREKRMVDDVAKSTREFIRKGDYAQLPTEAEEAQARQEQLELLHPIKEPDRTPDSELNQVPDHTFEHASERLSESAAEEAKPVDKKTESPQTGSSEIPMESPNLQKVRRARAKSAYTSPFGGGFSSGIGFQATVDRKA